MDLSSDKDDSSLTAYLMVHFMADPRKGRGCELPDCVEIDNQVCMLSASTDHGHTNVQKTCHDMAKERNVAWSDCKLHGCFNVVVK